MNAAEVQQLLRRLLREASYDQANLPAQVPPHRVIENVALVRHDGLAVTFGDGTHAHISITAEGGQP